MLAGTILLLALAAAYFIPRRAGRSGAEAGSYRTEALSRKVRSSQAVLAYLRRPGRDALEAALRACLAAREKSPGDLLNGFLLAFCFAEKGDPAGEEKALAGFRPEQKALYAYCFRERRADLAGALHYLPAYLCARMRESTEAENTFAQDARCASFGGPLERREYRRGGRTLERHYCARCDAMLGLPEGAFAGSAAFRPAVKGNSLLAVLPPAATDLEDRRRYRDEKRGGGRRLLAALEVKEGRAIAEIGCGAGQYTFQLAAQVGPKGKVYAWDPDGSLLAALRYSAEKGGATNIEAVPGGAAGPELPAGSLDMAVLVHYYRLLRIGLEAQGPERLEKYLDGLFASVRRALRKGGRLALADHLDPRFGVTAEKITAAMKKRGFRPAADNSGRTRRTLVLIFTKV